MLVLLLVYVAVVADSMDLLPNADIGQPCQGSFRCLTQCRCPQRISAPEQILRLLAYQQEHKTEDVSMINISTSWYIG